MTNKSLSGAHESCILLFLYPMRFGILGNYKKCGDNEIYEKYEIYEKKRSSVRFFLL